ATLESLRLQRLADRVRADPFDGDDLLVRRRRNRGEARAHGLTVEVDGAGSTERHPAAELGPGQAHLVSQRPQQGRLSGDVETLLLAVDVELDHRCSPLVIEPSR